MRILDLFCGAGGCSVGYARAGFEVVGVDLHPQPNYPFEFEQSDALEFLLGYLESDDLAAPYFDAIHASPPCQAFTSMSNRYRGKGGPTDDHVNLIPSTRTLLIASGLPYVIENVVAAVHELREPYLLNGGMFGLDVDRPRLFETNWPLLIPKTQRVPNAIGVYGDRPDGRRLNDRVDGSIQRAAASLDEAQAAMGIDWMPWKQLTQAIPPDYCELIGHQLAQWISTSGASRSVSVNEQGG